MSVLDKIKQIGKKAMSIFRFRKEKSLNPASTELTHDEEQGMIEGTNIPKSIIYKTIKAFYNSKSEVSDASSVSQEESKRINEKNQFLDFFVAKESLSKAYGTGLALGIKEIPALPFDGKVRYKEKTFFRHKMRIEGYFGSVSLENDDFSIEYEEIKEIV